MIELTPSFPALPGQPVLVHATASSLADITGLTLTVAGQPLLLDEQGRGRFVPAAPGRFVVEATATDTDGLIGTAATLLKVRDPADQAKPVVSLRLGLADAPLTAATPITGTISDANLDFWRLELAPFGFGKFQLLATGAAPIAAGTLTSLDPSQLANGIYRLRLTAADIGGRSASSEIVVEVNTSAKTSQLLRSETDLTAEFWATPRSIWCGSTIRSTWTAPAALGGGWRLAHRDTFIQTNVPLTGREHLGIYGPPAPGTRLYLRCRTAIASALHCTQIAQIPGLTYYTPAWQADSGVAHTLQSAAALLTRG